MPWCEALPPDAPRVGAATPCRRGYLDVVPAQLLVFRRHRIDTASGTANLARVNQRVRGLTNGVRRRPQVRWWHQGAVRSINRSGASGRWQPAQGAAVPRRWPSADGWTVVAVHESRESWEEFRDGTLMPRMSQGIPGGFTAPPEETGFEIANELRS